MTPAELSARKVDLEEAAGYLGDLRGIIVSMCLTPAASPELKLQAARAVHDLALALGLVSLAPAPKKAPRLSAKRQAPEESFETWWKVYPYKTAKGDARKAWGQTSMDRPPLEAMLATLAWQTRSRQWTKENGEFIPYPATYLRGHQWADEPRKAPNPSQPRLAVTVPRGETQAEFEVRVATWPKEEQDRIRRGGRR